MFVSRMISAARTAPECPLKLCGISKIYDKQVVVDQVSLTVDSGEIFGLLGPNGAGKTTLMKMIAGLSRPDSGRLEIFGVDGVRNRSAVKHYVGLVPQESNLERELMVEEALIVYARLFDIARPRQRADRIIEEFGLASMRTKRAGLLSGGMARRALIARALLPGPQLLLLDEPTVGLDPDVRHEIWNVIRRLAEAGKTVFMTTHYMEEADQLCRRIALLKAGKIVAAGAPDKVKALAGIEARFTLEEAFLRLVREGA